MRTIVFNFKSFFWWRLLVIAACLGVTVQAQQRTSSRSSSVGELLWSKLDPDQTGSVGVTGARARLEGWFAAIDYGAAKTVSQSEFLSRFPAMLRGEDVGASTRSNRRPNRFLGLFLVLDRNQDRQLSQGEFCEGLESKWRSWLPVGQLRLDRDRFVRNTNEWLPRTNMTGIAEHSQQVLRADLPEPPPSPVLTPEEALRSFAVVDGFRVEIAATEPMIEDPVAFSFDSLGRLFVVEMRSFMVDIEGSDEKAPVGRISLLEDLDRDGTFDRASRFLDQLILPRSALAINGGLLFVANYQLSFARDLDGDGRADEVSVVDRDYGRGNVEHAANGLLLGLDNWIYNARSQYRYRFLGNTLLRQETEFRGHWGITHDDQGRLFYNINNSQLLGDVTPPNYIARNRHHPSQAGLNLYVATDQRVFPIRMNTAVNRGYLPDVLDSEGRLHVFASSCSPMIYRGHRYGEDFVGNAFVCDPAANLIKRNLIDDRDLTLSSVFAYPDREFFASTDERFRPVALSNGPDGNLWVLDMYRGIAQYGMFMTKYLREETLRRRLDKGIHFGRVYRIVKEGAFPDGSFYSGPLGPPLTSRDELLAALSHPNGWVRDMAQQEILERGELGLLTDLLELANRGPQTYSRLHALWTIEGLGVRSAAGKKAMVRKPGVRVQLVEMESRPDVLVSGDSDAIEKAFHGVVRLISDSDRHVQTTAIRVAEALALGHRDRERALTDRLVALVPRLSLESQFQAALSGGALPKPAVFPVFQKVLATRVESNLIREAVMSGLAGWEFSFLQALTTDPAWSEPSPGARSLVHALCAAVMREGEGTKIRLLLSLLTNLQRKDFWMQDSLISGLSQGVRGRGRRSVIFDKQPPELGQLAGLSDRRYPALVNELESVFAWPGHRDEALASGRGVVQDRSAEDEAIHQAGRELFVSICAGCHGMNGEGVKPMAPPLAGSEWVLGEPSRLVRIILQGMEGAVSVAGRRYQVPDILPGMPPLAVLDDGQVATIANYLRTTWEHDAAAISPALVDRVRSTYRQRETPWTSAELLDRP